MSTFLTIAADFIDQMVNPTHGVLVNQDYALQFAEFLTSETGSLEKTLYHEAERLSDCNALTATGWIWFLGWARSEEIPLREDLLVEITQKWSSVFIQTLAIEIGIQNAERGNAKRITSVFEFEHPFLRKILTKAVEVPEDFEESKIEREPEMFDEIRTNRAESLLVALLDVDSDITFDAAAALLRHQWIGRPKLANFYMFLKAGLDTETQIYLDERIALNGYQL